MAVFNLCTTLLGVNSYKSDNYPEAICKLLDGGPLPIQYWCRCYKLYGSNEYTLFQTVKKGIFDEPTRMYSRRV